MNIIFIRNCIINPRLFITIISLICLISCEPNTIDKQVDEIITTTNDFDITKIAYSLADSLDTKPSKLLIALYPQQINNRVNRNLERNVKFALRGIISRYSEISDPKIEKCLSYITDPNPLHALSNNNKLDLIIYGLDLPGTNDKFKTILVNSALKHNDTGMLKLIEQWKQDRNSETMLNAIKLFDQKVLLHLSDQIVNDDSSIELLARIGEPAISTMKRKMRSNEQSIRFAAGDVLVKMIEYHPNALISLTSAINKNGIKTIARNYPFYIRLGQSGSEQILLKALRYNFTTTMCVDYLNCGSKTIEDGATKIAKANGYIVTPGFGNHSGPIWGNGN
jgi:hypothetical protein